METDSNGYTQERRILEESLGELGMDRNERRKYTMAKFGARSMPEIILDGPIVSFDRIERTRDMQLREARRTIEKVEKEYPQAKELYEHFLQKIEERGEGV